MLLNDLNQRWRTLSLSIVEPQRVGYVLKRYPRYSETFIVNEILAHEAAGLEVEIFALRPPADTHFQDRIARVRGRVNYIPNAGTKGTELWSAIGQTATFCPHVWSELSEAASEDVRDVFQAIWLAREATLRNITHLHAHFATASTTVARIASRIARLPFSFTAHAKDIFHETVNPKDLRRKLVDASAVVTVSDYNLAYLRDRFESDAASVQRVYNGLDLCEFSYTEPRKRAVHIVAVGRLVEKKGFAVLVEACHALRERGRRFLCSIIGSGELEAELREHVSRRDLEAVVQLIGPRPQRDVIQIIQQAAVLAAPCLIGDDANRDGLPTVLLEAMAVGTPCVSTNVTGIPEVVHHERTGLMVPQRDPFALAAAIERLLDDPELRVQLAEAARRLIEADFDIQRNAAELRQVFRVADNSGLKYRVEPSSAIM